MGGVGSVAVGAEVHELVLAGGRAICFFPPVLVSELFRLEM